MPEFARFVLHIICIGRNPQIRNPFVREHCPFCVLSGNSGATSQRATVQAENQPAQRYDCYTTRSSCAYDNSNWRYFPLCLHTIHRTYARVVSVALLATGVNARINVRCSFLACLLCICRYTVLHTILSRLSDRTYSIWIHFANNILVQSNMHNAFCCITQNWTHQLRNNGCALCCVMVHVIKATPFYGRHIYTFISHASVHSDLSDPFPQMLCNSASVELSICNNFHSRNLNNFHTLNLNNFQSQN